MSHAKLRKDNNCLNCDAIVDGPYCKNCGQQNVEPKQTLWHLIVHFFEDITHFDGKFFATMKSLLFRPGFLSEEYIKGRRMKYLDPIRMYLFISTVFLLVFLSLNKASHRITRKNDPETVRIIDSVRAATKESNRGLVSTRIRGKKIMVLQFNDMYMHGLAHYDSVQRTLPDSAKSDWQDRFFEKRIVPVWPAYEDDPYNFFTNVMDKFWHSISKIFFISLPIFAFFLYLLYIRRRKQYYYVSHAIFALHVYSVSFLFGMIMQLLDNGYYSVPGGSNISDIIGLGMLVYLYIAMLRFYKQGWFKTLVKFLILSISMIIVILLIVLILFANSFFAMGAS